MVFLDHTHLLFHISNHLNIHKFGTDFYEPACVILQLIKPVKAQMNANKCAVLPEPYFLAHTLPSSFVC